MQTKRSDLRFYLPHARRNGYRTVLALAVVGAALCWAQGDLVAQDQGARVRDAKNGFSFVPPPGWVASKDQSNPQLRLVYMGPMQNSFRANVNLVVEKDTGESFAMLSKQAKEELIRMIPSLKVAEEGQIEIGGKETLYLSSTYRIGPYSIRNAQFLVRGGNGKAYIVTYSTTNDAFERLGPSIVQSARSIRID
jgi:hypothetical protein